MMDAGDALEAAGDHENNDDAIDADNASVASASVQVANRAGYSPPQPPTPCGGRRPRRDMCHLETMQDTR